MLTREEIKNKIWQFLTDKYKKMPEYNFTNYQLTFGLHDLIADENQVFGKEISELAILPKQNEFRAKIQEIISELITNGLLYMGKSDNDSSNQCSYLTITSYGVECIKADNWLPYDPDGYLKQFRLVVPQIDEISFKYISESIQACNRRMLLSSTITLGAASENMMLQLIEAFVAAIEDPSRSSKFLSKLEERGIAGKYILLREEIKISIKKIPEELTRDLDTYLEGIFSFIRLNRNSAGHPTGRDLNIKILNANLQILPEYSVYIFNFIDFLKNHKV